MSNIINLRVPDGMSARCYLIVDNPNGKDLNLSSNDDKQVTIIRNKINSGGHLSRNKGLEAGSGDYILFLDDDTEGPENLLEPYLAAHQEQSILPWFYRTSQFPLLP